MFRTERGSWGVELPVLDPVGVWGEPGPRRQHRHLLMDKQVIKQLINNQREAMQQFAFLADISATVQTYFSENMNSSIGGR